MIQVSHEFCRKCLNQRRLDIALKLGIEVLITVVVLPRPRGMVVYLSQWWCYPNLGAWWFIYYDDGATQTSMMVLPRPQSMVVYLPPIFRGLLSQAPSLVPISISHPSHMRAAEKLLHVMDSRERSTRNKIPYELTLPVRPHFLKSGVPPRVVPLTGTILSI